MLSAVVLVQLSVDCCGRLNLVPIIIEDEGRVLARFALHFGLVWRAADCQQGQCGRLNLMTIITEDEGWVLSLDLYGIGSFGSHIYLHTRIRIPTANAPDHG